MIFLFQEYRLYSCIPAVYVMCTKNIRSLIYNDYYYEVSII